jgi:hypothetical protein
MAESACGRNDLARWHHQAAINTVKAMVDKAIKNAKATDEAEKKKEAEKQVSPDALQAAGMAQEALDALGPGK